MIFCHFFRRDFLLSLDMIGHDDASDTWLDTGVLNDRHGRRRLRAVFTRLAALLSNCSLDVQVQQLELVSHKHTHTEVKVIDL